MKEFFKGMAIGLLVGAGTMVLCGSAMSHGFDRIIRHESQGNPNAIGDQGRSHGLAQISVPYYIDARKEMIKRGITPPPFQAAVKDRYWTEQLMHYYMLRYCPKALASGDLETIAKIHNGGPAGAKKSATAKYWAKIKKTK